MTMTSLTADISCNFRVTGRRSVGIDNPTDALREIYADSLLLGTAVDTMNELYHATRSFVAGADILDLAGGLTDALGQTITFVEVVFFFLKNRASNGTITIGNTALNPFLGWFDNGSTLDAETVEADGWAFHHNPNDPAWVVTPATGDLLLISGTAVESYDIIIGGRNA